MAIYVGRWDCTACGTRGILGPETRCPNCGAPRPEDVRFYLASEEDIVRDKAGIREARAGTDWICGHCSGQNKATQTVCETCGNPRDALSEDVNLRVRRYREGTVPDQAPQKPSSTDMYEESARRHQAGRFRKLRPMLWIMGLALAALVVSGFFPIGVDAEVVGFSWQRSIQMEHFEPVAYEDWEVASGAFDVQEFEAIHHYKKEYSHTERRYREVREQVGTERYVCGKVDMGNGYFQDQYCTRPVYATRSEPYDHDVYRDVPVYRTKYAFKVMQWVANPAYVIRSEGQDHDARWPQPPASLTGEDWRAGKRAERYFVTVKSGGLHQEQVGLRYWEGLRLGEAIPARRAWLYGAWYGLRDPAHRQ